MVNVYPLYRVISKEYLPVAQPLSLARILDAQVIDEIHLSWVGGTSSLLCRNSIIVDIISACISIPLAVSCRISTFKQAATLFSLSADKVIIGTNLFHSPSLLSQIAKVYGRQAIVASFDYTYDDNLFFPLHNHKSPIPASQLPSLINDLGVGEVSLNAIDYDGKQCPHSIFSLINISEFKIPVSCFMWIPSPYSYFQMFFISC